MGPQPVPPGQPVARRRRLRRRRCQRRWRWRCPRGRRGASRAQPDRVVAAGAQHLVVPGRAPVPGRAGGEPQLRARGKLRWAWTARLWRAEIRSVRVENRTFQREFFMATAGAAGGRRCVLVDRCTAWTPRATAWPESAARFNFVLWNLWNFYEDHERRLGRGSNLTWYAGMARSATQWATRATSSSRGSRCASSRTTATAANVGFGYWSHDLAATAPAALRPSPSTHSFTCAGCSRRVPAHAAHAHEPRHRQDRAGWSAAGPAAASRMCGASARPTAPAWPRRCGCARGWCRHVHRGAARMPAAISVVSPLLYDHPPGRGCVQPGVRDAVQRWARRAGRARRGARGRARLTLRHTRVSAGGPLGRDELAARACRRCRVEAAYAPAELGGAYVREARCCP